MPERQPTLSGAKRLRQHVKKEKQLTPNHEKLAHEILEMMHRMAALA